MPYKDKQKQRKAQREWYERQDKSKRVERNRQDRAKRRRVVNQYKSAHGCSRCGYNESPAAIDAHHTGAKNFTISRGIQDCKPIAEIVVELERCELICANCHRLEHASRYL